MQTRWLYLPVEIKSRELDAKLLLAAEALYRGYSVVVGSKRMMRLLPRLPAGGVLFKSAVPVREYEPAFCEALASGHRIYVHDEEGLVHLSDDHYRTRLPEACLRRLSGFFCWGPKQAAIVEEERRRAGLCFPVHVTGHPRIDLMRAPLSECFAVGGGPCSSWREDFVLVNTNFQAFNHLTGWRRSYEAQKASGFHPDAASQRFRLRYIRHEQRVFRRYIRLVRALAESFSEHHIVVRPHPSERVSTWEARVGALPNVTVTNRDSVGYWIRHARAVVHTGCTTGIEALVMKAAPPVSFDPVPSVRYSLPLPDEVSVTAHDTTEAVQWVQRILQDDLSSEHLASAWHQLATHVSSLEGDYAFSRILDVIDAQDAGTDRPHRRAGSVIGSARARARMSDALRFGRAPRLAHGTRKFPATSEQEISDRLYELLRLLGYPVRPGVTKIGMNTFALFSPESRFLEWLSRAAVAVPAAAADPADPAHQAGATSRQ